MSRRRTAIPQTYVLDPNRKGPFIEDVWPTLFHGAETVPEMRRKTGALPWARDLLGRMVSEADEIVDSKPRLDPGQPGWRHDFYSPDSGEHLLFNPSEPGPFVDPTSGSTYSDDSMRSAWVLLQHERTYRLMRSMGFLHALTGREEYRDWVHAGMMEAVEFFRGAERNQEKKGAIYFQPLYDAQVLLLLANSYDLTRQSYSDEEAEGILGALFEDGARSLVRHEAGAKVHNITCYVMAAIAAAGLVLDNDDWVDLALHDDDHGFTALLERGLGREGGITDGFWWEGTTFYHFYATCPLFYLYEVYRSRDADPDLVDRCRRELSAMLWAPFRLSDQRLRLPWLGDLGSQSLGGLESWSHLYEYGYGIDPTLSGVLSASVEEGQRGISALAFGPGRLTSPRRVERSTSMGPSGLAVLRAGSGEGPYYALLRAGRHGGGHDHLDKLEVVFHAMGEILLPDIGTSGYALRDFKAYCVSTLAHNTLMVDDRNQERVADAGSSMDGERRARGVVRDAYPGVTMEREVELDPPRLIVSDTLSSEAEHTYSQIFHAAGSLNVRGMERGRSPVYGLPREGPFRFLKGGGSTGMRTEARGVWMIGDRAELRFSTRCEIGFELLAARSPGNPMTRCLDTIMARTNAEDCRITTEFTAVEGDPQSI